MACTRKTASHWREFQHSAVSKPATPTTLHAGSSEPRTVSRFFAASENDRASLTASPGGVSVGDPDVESASLVGHHSSPPPKATKPRNKRAAVEPAPLVNVPKKGKGRNGDGDTVSAPAAKRQGAAATSITAATGYRGPNLNDDLTKVVRTCVVVHVVGRASFIVGCDVFELSDFA